MGCAEGRERLVAACYNADMDNDELVRELAAYLEELASVTEDNRVVEFRRITVNHDDGTSWVYTKFTDGTDEAGGVIKPKTTYRSSPRSG